MPDHGEQQPPLSDAALDALLAKSQQRARDAIAKSMDLDAGAREVTGQSSTAPLPTSGGNKPTVLVVEDDPGVAEALALALRSKFEVLGIAYSGEEALRMVRENPPDVITMDLGLPDTDGNLITQIITKEHPSSRVVMATARGGQRDLLRGLAAGAVGFLTKPFSRDELLATVEEAARGGFPIAAAIIAATMPRTGHEQPPVRLDHLFTPLEKTVLRGLADDLTIAQIAAQTALTPEEIVEVQALIVEKINLRNALEQR
ncbi:response regulator transcription factor [Kribbella deserti]|uniref:Response regulator transcription factor n=1 Tax=Kribbella deserti TaxID=1926257 RepID=A0ABV6QFJ1_9ACTN